MSWHRHYSGPGGTPHPAACLLACAGLVLLAGAVLLRLARN